MNNETFMGLMGLKKKPTQEPGEWRYYMDFCFSYFQARGMNNPVVVELGIYMNRQKRFYEEILGADHIGIDNNPRRNPDIMADSHSRDAQEQLLRMLGGRSIDLLYIDAGHLYKDAKMDLEQYAPLSKHLVALHDVCHIDPKHPEVQVKKLWNEICEGWMGHTKITINAKPNYMGIGILIQN